MKPNVWCKSILSGAALMLIFGCGGGGGDSAPRTPQAVLNDPPPTSEPAPMYVASGAGLVSAPSHLYTLLPGSGEIATDIGTIIEEGTDIQPPISDIAVTPGGLLFGCSYDTLYLIDKETARARVIGRLGVRNVNALAFNKTEGFLYGATRDGKILNINPNRPQDTIVLFQLPIGYSSSGDLVFASDGTLYATLRFEGQEDDLIAVIDLDDRTVDPLSTGSGAVNIFGLSYFDEVLYGLTAASAPANGAIWRINPATGEAVFIDNLPFSAFGSN